MKLTVMFSVSPDQTFPLPNFPNHLTTIISSLKQKLFLVTAIFELSVVKHVFIPSGVLPPILDHLLPSSVFLSISRISSNERRIRIVDECVDMALNALTKVKTLSKGCSFSNGLRAIGFGSEYSTAAAAADARRAVSSGDLGLWDKEYEEYRKSVYGGDLNYKALLVDAVGTLVAPSQPMAQIYRQMGEKYGVKYSENEILNRYRRAYEQPWGKSSLRYVDDGRPFWQHIVSSSTGCSDPQYFEELYNYYATDKAWHLCDPNAEEVFKALRNAGVKLAVVSNFDTRLRPVLRALGCDHWFDAIAVSAEVAAEKPNPTIFLKACDSLGVNPEDAVHVGDDRRNDIWGARDAGCHAWLWGSDVLSFKEVAERIGVKV